MDAGARQAHPVLEADALFGEQRPGRDLRQRPARRHRIVAGRVVEHDAAVVEPQPQAPPLAAHHRRRRRADQHRHHIARAVAHPEEQDLGAGEPGGDLDAAVAQIGGERRLRRRGPRRQGGSQREGGDGATHPSNGATE